MLAKWATVIWMSVSVLMGMVAYAYSQDTAHPLPYTSIYMTENSPHDIEADEPLVTIIGQGVLLEKVAFAADIPLSEEECHSLTGLEEGQLLTMPQLVKALSYLQKKKIFKTCEIALSQGQQGIVLHIHGTTLWTFARLVLHGVVVGKDMYRRYYLMEAGDAFSDTKHEQSVERIIEALHKEGYFLCNVWSRLDYNYTLKAVTVHIHIKRGKRFSVGTVSLCLHNGSYMPTVEGDSIRAQIHNIFFNHLRGKAYTRDMIAKESVALKKFLYQQGFFETDVHMLEDVDKSVCKVTLTLTITLNNRCELIFIGNNFFSSEQLLNALKLFGRSLGLLPPSVLKQEILKLYQAKGFFDVDIQVKTEQGRAFFIIHEGQQASLGAITLCGCMAYDPAFLIKTYCSSLTKSKTIDQAVVEQACNEIVTFYADEGFLDARITKTEWVEADETATKEVRISIDEGELYTIKAVHVEGKLEYDTQGPFSLCNKSGQMPFTVAALAQQREWLIAECVKEGTSGLDIKPHIQRDGHAITILWSYGASQAVPHFGKTVVIGAQSLPYSCILRELTYKEGDLWDREKLKTSMKRLRTLDIFDSVQLYPDPTHDSLGPEEGRTILAKLVLDDPCEIRMRGGLGLQQVSSEYGFSGLTYRAGCTFIYKNPCNVADQFSCTLDLAKSDKSLVARYQRPWLFGFDWRPAVQVYFSRQNHPAIIRSKQDLYQVSQEGILGTVSKTHAYGSWGINLGVEFMETSPINDGQRERELIRRLARAINFESQLLNKTIPYALCEPTILIDRVDNKLNPTKGTFTLASLKAMVPLSHCEGKAFLVKFMVEHSCFVPLKSVVAAMRIRVGHIFLRAFNNIMPIERFYLGGAHSIRSYDTDMAPPLGIFVDEDDKPHCVPRGGKSMINVNFEARLPLYKQVGIVLFQDFGALSSDHLAAVKPCDVLSATGFGLRYDTVFGPLRFDIGWKWRSRARCETLYAWCLALGQAF